MSIVKSLIEQYKLSPHPEGGWYTQTYKSKEIIPANALPTRFAADRPISTAIYFLLEEGNFSAFHKIKSDECWHFYLGNPLEIFIILPDGSLQTILLGNNFNEGQHFQFIVPANCWFASRPAPGSAFSFVGCTVSPGFDFDDFELAKEIELTNQYPQHQLLIQHFCRQ
jgi:uncharacterized protein